MSDVIYSLVGIDGTPATSRYKAGKNSAIVVHIAGYKPAGKSAQVASMSAEKFYEFLQSGKKVVGITAAVVNLSETAKKPANADEPSGYAYTRLDANRVLALKFEGWSASRYSNDSSLFILAEVCNSGSAVAIGYRVAYRNRTDKTAGMWLTNLVSKADVISRCRNMSNTGNVGVVNGQFVADGGFVKAYPGFPFIVETLEAIKPQPATKPTIKSVPQPQLGYADIELAGEPVPVEAVSKPTITRDMFTPEQMLELEEGKIIGVKYQVYAKPELSAEQMRALRLAMGSGVKPDFASVYLAKVELSPDVITAYGLQKANGLPVESYYDERYDVAQIMEIGVGYRNGVDLAPFINPSATASEIATVRERLEVANW